MFGINKPDRLKTSKQISNLKWGIFMTVSGLFILIPAMLYLGWNLLDEQSDWSAGDILTFSGQGPELKIRVNAWAVAENNKNEICVLDAHAMTRSGGSIMVLNEVKPDMALVHWQGGETSGDDKNCGHSVDMMLKQSDLDVLANMSDDYRVMTPGSGGTMTLTNSNRIPQSSYP